MYEPYVYIYIYIYYLATVRRLAASKNVFIRQPAERVGIAQKVTRNPSTERPTFPSVAQVFNTELRRRRRGRAGYLAAEIYISYNVHIKPHINTIIMYLHIDKHIEMNINHKICSDDIYAQPITHTYTHTYTRTLTASLYSHIDQYVCTDVLMYIRVYVCVCITRYVHK